MNDSQIENTNEELNRLYSLRKEAIDSLIPDMEKIEGVDEERKVEIYMTAARITNNSSLISLAYGAAKNISDTVARAEALIDIIQEANYAINKLENNRPL